MTFHIITIFPEIFDSYFNESIIGRARGKKLIDIKIHNLRDYTKDKHKTVDDAPYGGGAGMVMKVEPINECLESIKAQNYKKTKYQAKHKTTKTQNIKRDRIILFSAKGKRYVQEDAKRLAKYDSLIMICGRYEGVDERVAGHLADEELSIGEYVLTGGEIPAMVVADTITRLIPGVLGNEISPVDESFSKPGTLEYPQYTRPADFHGWKVPDVLMGGDHAKINQWRQAAKKNNKNGKRKKKT